VIKMEALHRSWMSTKIKNRLCTISASG